MRVAFLCNHDPDNHNEHSGIPYSMKRELMKAAEVMAFRPPADAVNGSRRWHTVQSVGKKFSPAGAKPVLRQLLTYVDPTFQATFSESVRQQLLGRWAPVSAQLAEMVVKAGVDAVFTCFSSNLLVDFDVDVPLVYYSDSTARALGNTYAMRKARSDGYKSAYDVFEHRALHRSAAAILATEVARQSAINDYGVTADRVHVVPMGANVLPDGEQTRAVGDDPPSRSSFRLCITAANPVRKGLDLAIDAVEILQRNGWNAELTYIGPPTGRARRSPYVRCAGRLRLSEPADRIEHQRILADSHMMILPSKAEAFGIAPAEAAHQGRPSIVSTAGGLSEVVQHDRTGIVMPATATAADYAGELVRLAEDPDRYAAMCRAALCRAREELNWEHWGQRAVEIINEVIRQ